MISFPRACELVPTTESYCVSTGAGFDRSLRLLSRNQPTALVSVPSIIERTLDAARESRSPVPNSIRRVIYIGEGMDAALRRHVQATLGAEGVFLLRLQRDLALGIECAAHAGIHLFGSRTLFEIEMDPAAPRPRRTDSHHPRPESAPPDQVQARRPRQTAARHLCLRTR